MKYSTACSIGILVSFFLPWIYVSFLTVTAFSGYEIPLSLNEVTKTIEYYFGSNSIDWDRYNLWINAFFYSIPIFSLINIIKDLSNSKLNWNFAKGFEFGIGVGLVSILYWSTELLKELETKTPKIGLGIGFYLTGLFSVLGIVFLIIERYWNSEKSDLENNSENEISPKIQENESLESITNKKDLINQLNQLFELKEKGVISESLYERERESILKVIEEDNTNINYEEEIEIHIEKSVPENEIYDINEPPANNKPEINKTVKIFLILLIVSVISYGIYYLNEKEKKDTVINLISGRWEMINVYELFGVSVNGINYEFQKDGTFTEISYASTLSENGREIAKPDTINGNYFISSDLQNLTIYDKQYKNSEKYTESINSDFKSEFFKILKITRDTLILNSITDSKEEFKIILTKQRELVKHK